MAMAMDLQRLAQLLQASLDPKQNKQAEATIQQEEGNPGFSLALLHVVASDAFPHTTRLASALYFKNFLKRNWMNDKGEYQLPQNDIVAIKTELIGLMISVPPSIQAQLGDAISVIADSDFYERWDTLVDDLVSRLTADNPVVNNGVLQVAHSIFKRWRPLFRSDALFTEINHVLSKFGTPFVQLLINTDRQITQNQANKEVLQQWFTTLNLTLKLFYDLSCQDLPPVFEENIQDLAGLLHKYLVYDNPALHTDDEGESGILEYVRSGIFEVLILYTQKYEDAFGSLLGQFVQSSWTLLTNIGSETKYDILVSKALKFLTAVAHIMTYAQAFNNEQTLGEVVEKVIIPNLALRESDIELFEDEPIEFIRRDLEGSDNDTRRRAATDFLRQLMEQFDKLVTDVVSKYVNHYLQDYAKDKKNNWKSKDTAVYLFTSIAAKGVTSGQGVKTVNSHVDVIDFFQKNIAEDLTTDDVHPVLKVDAIKYLHTFRSQLNQQQWHAAFPLLVNHLGSSNYVIYNYAAIAVERVLTLSVAPGQPIIPKDDVAALSKDLLQHLFKLITKETAPEKIQENEFIMRCVMRVLLVIREGVLSITDMVLKNFVNITMVIRHNPANPRFYYYHFEGIGALIRFAAPSQPDKLEQALYAPFAECLTNDVREFTPYVFQLFAALLEANPSKDLSEYYKNLIPPIIMPPLWEQKGNVPALVRLLSSLIPKDPAGITQRNQLEPILGIFQKLVSTKAHENQAFDLIEAVVGSFDAAQLQQYFVPMVQIMLTRLSTNPTEIFKGRFVRFYHFVSARVEKGLGTDFFIGVTDQIQHDVFKPIYLTIILPDTQKLTRPLDRKTAVLSFAKTLATSEAFQTRYPKGWALTCEALLKLLINPPVITSAQNDAFDAAGAAAEHDVDDASFGVGFTELRSVRAERKDGFPEVTDVKRWVGAYLAEKDKETGGRIEGCVRERLSEQAKLALGEVMGGAAA